MSFGRVSRRQIEMHKNEMQSIETSYESKGGYNNDLLMRPLALSLGKRAVFTIFVYAILSFMSYVMLTGFSRAVVVGVKLGEINSRFIFNLSFLIVFGFLFITVMLFLLKLFRDLLLFNPVIILSKDSIWDRRLMFSPILWSNISSLKIIDMYAHGKRTPYGIELKLLVPVKVKFDFFYVKDWGKMLHNFGRLSEGYNTRELIIQIKLLDLQATSIIEIARYTHSGD